MTWAIKHRYDYEPIKIISETEKTVLYEYRNWDGSTGQPTRLNKSYVLKWRGDEAMAIALAARLEQARKTYNAVVQTAFDHYERTRAELVAEASAIVEETAE